MSSVLSVSQASCRLFGEDCYSSLASANMREHAPPAGLLRCISFLSNMLFLRISVIAHLPRQGEIERSINRAEVGKCHYALSARLKSNLKFI